MIRQAKESVQSFAQWLDEKAAPLAQETFSQEYAQWRQELEQIRALVEKPGQVRIALVGTTGAGKSTFLNAVLGQELLPVGVMQPCTAFVTVVRYLAGPGYRITVQFCSPLEWRSDLENLVAVLRPGETDEESGDRGESKRLINATRKRLQAIYGDSLSEGLDPEEILNRPLPSEAERIFAAGSVEITRFTEPKEMLSYLRKLIRGDSPLWPFIKQVTVNGPYNFLAGGLELIDLPGLNDPNEARVEVTRKFLRTSPFVWVVFPMVRGLTDDVQRIFREEKLLRTLVLSGTYSALSLVGTKADDIHMNSAIDLGLPEDCTFQELVAAYRAQTVTEARSQLEEMVRDLTTNAEEKETLARMIKMARQTPVHTVSANAYMKLKGIWGRGKDYGLDEEETGIPGAHRHLIEIAQQTGAVSRVETALKRLGHLHDEIAFFFRAKVQSPSREVEDARARIQAEHGRLGHAIRSTQENAKDQLIHCRKHFLEKMDSLLAVSVQEVRGITEEWQRLHWTTLRAIVQRNGVFKSPTNGRLHNLNEEVAEPLLGQLPVSWEQYFTEDLGRVTDEFVLLIQQSGKNFCDKVRLIIDVIFHRKDTSVEDQLTWFRDKVALLARTAKIRVLAAVRERRSDLAAKIPLVVQSRMQPSYKAAKGESGSGIKERILAHLQPAAIESARPIYTTIQEDLLAGLNELESIINRMLGDLAQAAQEQAKIVADNANIDVNEAATNPVMVELLNSMPPPT